MSCIVGLFHLGGAPVHRHEVEAMLVPTQARAPDGDRVHCEGPIALAQAFLRTGSSAAEAPNNLTLDGKVFIAADARIDGRAELVRRIRATGRHVPADAPHAELILHAYVAFGDAFLDHLLGDFAFALWDSQRARLLCVRDPFGIRPLYYFRSGDLVGFASDIEALRAHPAVSARTDRSAVADFLLFGTCMDVERTYFQDIRRIPPATRFELGASGMREERYWHLPQRETRYRSAADYVDHFDAVFESAVTDRLPGGSAAVPLSGGMDSTSIAAVAAPHATRAGFALTAYHMSSRKLQAEDEELELAQQVADHLAIRMVTQDLSDYPLLHDNRNPALRTPFPFSSGYLALHRDMLQSIRQSGARVLLSGYAGDAVFTPSGSYSRALWRSGRWLKLAREVAHHAVHTRTVSGLGLRRTFGPAHPALPSWRPAMPGWIAPGLVEELGLRDRWEAWWLRYRQAVDARDQLSLPWMDRAFEVSEVLPSPLVVRYPFLDRRLVEYLLSVPNHMLRQKKVLRRAMAGRLPAAITGRPKTGLPGDPVRKLFQTCNIDKRVLTCDLQGSRVIDRDALATAMRAYREGAGSDSTWLSSLILLPFAFEDWLAKSGASHE
jgi:asparagine synthase (glutamine-hydrolysing)